MSKAHYVVTAVGENRTGIVADISEVIFLSDCNIEDSQMSLLGDQFALLTLVSTKNEAAAQALSTACERLKAKNGMTVALFPVSARRSHPYQQVLNANFKLRVVGMDRSGIVCRTSRILADRAVDIIDLTTHVTRAPESGSPVFTLEAHLGIPGEADVDGLQRELKALSDELVVDILLYPMAL